MEPTGKARGGRARAEALSPERRAEIAAGAARARWAGAVNVVPTPPLTVPSQAVMKFYGQIEMRLECLRLARCLGVTTVEQVVQNAKAMEAYVCGPVDVPRQVRRRNQR